MIRVFASKITHLPMFQKLRRASHFSQSEWRYLAQAWFWLLFFDIGLRTRGFSTLQQYAAKMRPTDEAPARTQALIQALNTAVERARHHHIFPMTCLRRSLALQKMLANHGIAATLKIGVQKTDGGLVAHAWIEAQGQRIGEPERITEDYRVIY
jgi:hypothetical protein